MKNKNERNRKIKMKKIHKIHKEDEDEDTDLKRNKDAKRIIKHTQRSYKYIKKNNIIKINDTQDT